MRFDPNLMAGITEGLYETPNLHHPAVNNSKRLPSRWRIGEDTKDQWLHVHHCRFSVNDKDADRHLCRFFRNDKDADQHLCRLQKNDGDADRYR
jgi:hypothetical protein